MQRQLPGADAKNGWNVSRYFIIRHSDHKNKGGNTMKHNRLYKLYLTDSIRKEAFVGSWVVLECAEAMARHYLNLYAHSMKIEVVDTATMDTIGEYEIGSGKLVMNNTLNKAIDGYHANIARITEDFKRGSYKNAKECEIALGEEYVHIMQKLFELARYDEIAWSEYEYLSDRCFEYQVEAFKEITG